jgi:hypothetical protein
MFLIGIFRECVGGFLILYFGFEEFFDFLGVLNSGCNLSCAVLLQCGVFATERRLRMCGDGAGIGRQKGALNLATFSG